MGLVLRVAVALALDPPGTFLCLKPSATGSGDRADSPAGLELVAVDEDPDSLFAFGDMVLLEAELPPALLAELKSLWRLFFGVNTKCTV